VFGILSFILFVIAAILAWTGGSAAHHADAIAYAGGACLALEVVFAWRPWVHP
jgi:hypothetical protein